MSDELERLFADTGDTRLLEAMIERAMAQAAKDRSVSNWYGLLSAAGLILLIIVVMFTLPAWFMWLW